MPPLTAPPPRYVDIAEPPPAAVSAPPPAAQGAWVQLGAYRTRLKADEVVRAWRDRRPETPFRVHPVRLPQRGTWFRILAGPLAADGARALCREAAASATPCWARGDAAQG